MKYLLRYIHPDYKDNNIKFKIICDNPIDCLAALDQYLSSKNISIDYSSKHVDMLSFSSEVVEYQDQYEAKRKIRDRIHHARCQKPLSQKRSLVKCYN